MDVLTDVLDHVEMEGSLYYATCFSAPWAVEMPSDGRVCRFHVVTEGGCTVTVPATGDEVRVDKGDLVLVPAGRMHRLQTADADRVTSLAQVMGEGVLDADGCLRWGAGGPVTRLVCGYLRFADDTAHPLLSTLPPLLRVSASPGRDFAWIDAVIRLIGYEAGSGLAGSAAISRRLSEVLFVQTMRHHASATSDDMPVLSAMMDPQLGCALRAIHRAPGAAWTVESLAREAALSRTAFAHQFRQRMTVTPMEYLTQVRLHRARRLLRAGRSTAEVGLEVGYRSEAAFRRAFKKRYGRGPGAYRAGAGSTPEAAHR